MTSCLKTSVGCIQYTGGHFKWNSSPEIAGLKSLSRLLIRSIGGALRGGGRFVPSDSPLGFPELELIESGLGSASFHYGHFKRGIQTWCLNLKWNSAVLYGLKGWMGGIKWNVCSSEIRHRMVVDQLCHINPLPPSDAVCILKKSHSFFSESQSNLSTQTWYICLRNYRVKMLLKANQWYLSVHPWVRCRQKLLTANSAYFYGANFPKCKQI